ncbi:hypothetical protein BH11ARM2_BH11ARM2_37670 [soil metagenome]
MFAWAVALGIPIAFFVAFVVQPNTRGYAIPMGIAFLVVSPWIGHRVLKLFDLWDRLTRKQPPES